MRYVYGPIKSRRLGLSLGLSLTPYKTCSLDCVYCQLGKTTDLTLKRKEYLPVKEIIDELRAWFMENKQGAAKLKFITLSGFGEPTLNSKIGLLIKSVKKIRKISVAVITNSVFLADRKVRNSLRLADLIVPSLDAVDEGIFEKIDRPVKGIKINKIIQGLIALRKEFKGKIWLEVMLVKGINDDLKHIRKLKEIILRINPDKIQLNLPVRSTAEPDIFAPDKKRLVQIKKILRPKAQVC